MKTADTIRTVGSGNGKKTVCGEKGIALVMVLVLAAIGLAMMTALIYMLTASTQISGSQKRYKTALEAGKGGTEVMFRFIAKRGFPDFGTLPMTPSLFANGQCLSDKLNKTTYAIPNGTPTYNWLNCVSNPASPDPAEVAKITSPVIDPTDPMTYDFSMDIGSTPTYRVYAKIVDTVSGNSGSDVGFMTKGVVASNSGEITVQSKPYLYTIEIDAENPANPQERGQYEVLYQY